MLTFPLCLLLSSCPATSHNSITTASTEYITASVINTHTHTQTHTHRQTHIHTDRHRHTHTHTHTHTHRKTAEEAATVFMAFNTFKIFSGTQTPLPSTALDDTHTTQTEAQLTLLKFPFLKNKF